MAPHPKNADGPFYVEDGCCITCGVMHDEAPGLLAWDEQHNRFWEGEVSSHCYVARQPSTPAEVTRMLSAMDVTDVDCLRYRGADLAILTWLGENDHADLCDAPVPPGVGPLVRSHATFYASPSYSDAAALADAFEAHLREEGSRPREPYLIKRPPAVMARATVRFAWRARDFHEITFAADTAGSWLVRHDKAGAVGRSVSRMLNGWLSADPRFRDVRWLTEAEYRAGVLRPTSSP